MSGHLEVSLQWVSGCLSVVNGGESVVRWWSLNGQLVVSGGD